MIHKKSDVDLKDAWEDISTPPPALKPFQKDLSYGRARGNTWGYQSKRHQERKHMDKFLYTRFRQCYFQSLKLSLECPGIVWGIFSVQSKVDHHLNDLDNYPDHADDAKSVSHGEAWSYNL
ncbi:hypothetical protein LTR96_011378 [Exophiala xenobiotica]|nr:hypothetical protein LTR41_011622 [Exophiala xenobiotica]KAK5215229.1 hypothetical protein LTR72_011698 [Exophiala xenobiotica]KAK5220957.1 hypothetical protein LTR47_010974 [Exophiala xenobiotica]KAK5243770.1 hypothetical protein LTS06_010531 [Exophiala xenobiotica]KAK5263207.1 hypothetical protein LTR96_011378 [Exophiala xenobiotica]